MADCDHEPTTDFAPGQTRDVALELNLERQKKKATEIKDQLDWGFLCNRVFSPVAISGRSRADSRGVGLSSRLPQMAQGLRLLVMLGEETGLG